MERASRASRLDRSLPRSDSYRSPLYSMPSDMGGGPGYGSHERHLSSPPSHFYGGGGGDNNYYERDDGMAFTRSYSMRALDTRPRSEHQMPPSLMRGDSFLMSRTSDRRNDGGGGGGSNGLLTDLPSSSSPQQRDGFRQSDGPVDFVHHDSPYGPAISVYPTRNHNPKPAPPTFHSNNDNDSAGSNRLFRAEQEKLAEYSGSNNNHMDNQEENNTYQDHLQQPQGHHHHQERDYHSHGGGVEGDRSLSSRSLLSSGSRSTGSRSTGSRSTSGPSKAVVTPPPSPPPTEPSHRMIEIAPGYSLRLRGAAETQEAIRRDQIVSSLCFACELEPLFSINDAEYVLCPQCRVVNPLPDAAGHGVDGVALGFTLETLESIQRDLAASSYHHSQQPHLHPPPHHHRDRSKRTLRHSTGGRLSGWR